MVDVGNLGVDGRGVVEATPRRGLRSLLEPARLVGAASILAGLVVWELYARSLENNIFFPTFLSMIEGLVGLVQDPGFWDAYRQTLIPFFWGWVTSMLAGVLIGLVAGLSKTIWKLVSPYVAFFHALPVSVLVPVVVVAFGIDLLARSSVVFLFGFFEVMLSTVVGVAYISDDIRDMTRSFGMGPLRAFRRVVLPGAMPAIMAGLRIGTGRAVVGMVVMELLLVSVGVGRLVIRYRALFQSPELYAVVFTLAIFGLAALALMRRLEVYVLRWRVES
jgi:ABC-type nitrate/sulfonate/bicarbonate transport system permease component